MAKRKIVGYTRSPGGGQIPIYEDSQANSGQFTTSSAADSPPKKAGGSDYYKSSTSFTPVAAASASTDPQSAVSAGPRFRAPAAYDGSVGATTSTGSRTLQPASSGVGTRGAWSSLDSASFTTSNEPNTQRDTRDISPATDSASGVARFGNQKFHATGSPGTASQSTVAAEPQFHATGSPGTTSQSTVPTEPQYHASGSPGTTSQSTVSAEPQYHATGSPATEQYEEPEAPELAAGAEDPEYEKFSGIEGFDSDLFKGLSDEDKQLAIGTYNSRGPDAFAKFLADKAMSGENKDLTYSPDVLQALSDAKKAFSQGGSADAFKVADEINILTDPNSTPEQKEQAKNRIQDILNNPTEDAGGRTGDAVIQDEELDEVVTFIEEVGLDETNLEEKLENLDVDEETKEAISTVLSNKRNKVDKASEAFKERMLAAMRGEGIVDDAGYGTMGGLPRVPPNLSSGGTTDIQATRWYLNQALSRARHGQYSRGWAQIVGDQAELAGMGDNASQRAWAENRIKKAFDSFQEKHNAERKRAAQESDASSSPLMEEFVNNKKEENNRKRRQIELEQKKLTNTQYLFDKISEGGDVSDADLEGIDPFVVERLKDVRERVRQKEVADRAGQIGLDVESWTQSEQDRIAASNEGKLKRFQVETKRIQDENARIMEQYEQDRQRSRSAFEQRQMDFQESERQRSARNQELQRIVDTAPQLATNIALPYEQIDPETGELAPTESAIRQGIPDRVASAEGKILEGGTLTEADLRGLPADQRDRLINLSTTSTNLMGADDLSRADREVQIEARRRLLDPFTQGSGANVYGMGNANQTFGRNVMSGLEERIASELDNVRVNADVERASQKRGINTQYDQAVERLARVFATSPDKLSGAAQRRFEELESGRAQALNQVDVTLDSQVREETRRNIEMMRGLQESREGAAYRGQELGIQALREATGFAGQLTSQDMQQQGVDLQEAQLEEQRQARMSGEALDREMAYGGGTDVSMSNLGISPDLGRTDQMFQLADRLPSVLGRAPTQEEVNTLLDGGSLPGRTTLAAEMQRGQLEEQRQARLSSETLQREQIYGGDAPISMSNLGISPDLSRSDQMFQLADKLPGVLGRAPTQEEVNALLDGGSLSGRTTVDAEIQRRQIAVQEDQQKVNAEIQRGELGLSETIQKGNLAIAERGMTLDEANTYGQSPEVSMSSLTGIEGALMNESGGLSEGSTLEDVFSAGERIEASFLQQIGRKPSAGEMTSLLSGGTVGGRMTLAAREAQSDRTHALSLQANDNELAREQLYGGYVSEYDRKVGKSSTLAKVDQDARNSIAKKAQALDEKIQTGQLSNSTLAIYSDVLGYVRDPETGIRVSTLSGKANLLQDKEFKDSVRRFNAQFLGELTDENGNIKEGIDSKAASAQIASTLSQINRSDRELNSNIGIAWANLTGQTGMAGPITANDLGMDLSALSQMNPMSWQSTEEWEMAKNAISDMSGTSPTDDQIRSVLSGNQIMVEGAPTLEAKSISAKVMQQNMDRAVQVDQMEKEFGLKKGQIAEATEAADRQWALATQDVASIFDISQDDWALARSKYERGLANGLTPLEASRSATYRSELSESDFMKANNLFEERFGQAARQAAINTGLSGEQWEATKAARKTMDDRETKYWDGIMNNVGQNINYGTILDQAALPDLGDYDPELQVKLQQGVDGLITTWASEGDAGQKAMLEAGLRNMFLRDPDGARQKLEAISRMDNMTSNRLVQLQNQGIPNAISMAFYDKGNTFRQFIDAFNQDIGSFGYTGINQDKITDESIKNTLRNNYEFEEKDIDKYVRSIRNGENVKIPPKDWIVTMDPHLRQEVLSLIHGGSSFAIAQKEPSLAQSLGGIAGAGLTAFMGAGAPGLGGAAAAIGGKLFDGLFGSNEQSKGRILNPVK